MSSHNIWRNISAKTARKNSTLCISQRRRFTNRPNQPCKSGEKSKSMNKSVIALFCVLNISIFRIGTYTSVLILFYCVIGC